METPLTPEVLVPRLGDVLVEKGLITAGELADALAAFEQARRDGREVRIGQVMVEQGLITREQLDQAITEQIRQLHKALVEANQQLERRVQARTAELQVALNKLSELNQLKSNIISNVSHELRTPLTHIKGYMELLGSQSLGPLTAEQQNALRVMVKSGERLEQLIDDLIRFSTTARGEFALRLAPVDLRGVCDALVKRSQPRAEEHQVRLECSIDMDMPRVSADEEKITWVILQLLDNAIKFTPPGGVVRLSCENEQGLCVVAVEDTGIGIPAERYQEIFEPFHQLDGASTRRYGGTGLGLALVKQIIEAHGTAIEVESTPGSGTRFHFDLNFAE
jgi:signal transduction histidine kinase